MGGSCSLRDSYDCSRMVHICSVSVLPDGLGLSDSQTGLLLTLTLVGDTVVSLYLTTRADRIGRQRMLIIGAILMAAADLAFAFTHNFLLLTLAGTIGVTPGTPGIALIRVFRLAIDHVKDARFQMGGEQPVVFIVHRKIVKELTFRTRQLDSRDPSESLRLYRAHKQHKGQQTSPDELLVYQDESSERTGVKDKLLWPLSLRNRMPVTLVPSLPGHASVLLLRFTQFVQRSLEGRR